MPSGSSGTDGLHPRLSRRRSVTGRGRRVRPDVVRDLGLSQPMPGGSCLSHSTHSRWGTARSMRSR
jgi:hypothetical protein